MKNARCFPQGVAVGAGKNRTFQEAQQRIIPVIMPTVLFSGYLVAPTRLPPFLHWIYDLSFFQHAVPAPANISVSAYRFKSGLVAPFLYAAG